MIVKINSIAKETEKAILVNANVCYNGNKGKAREIWMPKSCVKIISEDVIEIADWFASKLSWQNSFKGYQMRFEWEIEPAAN